MLAKLEPIRMVQNVQNVELFDKRPSFFQTIFDKVLMSFCKTINFQITIFQCSKINGKPTRATRLKSAPNMADPTCVKGSVSSLKFVQMD